jgi:hypothetical protein
MPSASASPTPRATASAAVRSTTPPAWPRCWNWAAFAAGPQPQRTLYFVALTAEEKGLLGASYYAAHPLAPLDKTAAVLNIEMFSPDGPTRDIASWGKGRVSLEGDLERVAKARGRSYSPDPNLEAGFFYRADHFAFARLGVPAITIGPGLDKLDGGVEAGRAAREVLRRLLPPGLRCLDPELGPERPRRRYPAGLRPGRRAGQQPPLADVGKGIGVPRRARQERSGPPLR